MCQPIHPSIRRSSYFFNSFRPGDGIWLLAGVLCLAVLAVPATAAVFPVTSATDPGPGSLRDALVQANAAPGADTIVFNIPLPGVVTIFVSGQLPPLTDPAGVMIDGYTQPGASPGLNPPATAVILIELSGVQAGPAHGLWIQSPNNWIQGLAINSFSQDGIHIEATPLPTASNRIWGNFIGTDPSGTIDRGNGWNQTSLWAGVTIAGSAQTPGQALDNWIQYNLISGNYAEGVSIMSLAGNDVALNHVEPDNRIGTDVTGTVDMGNDHVGVYIGEGAHDNFVILNIISGNDYEGVSIVGYPEPPPIFTDNNLVADNLIGVDLNLNPLGNSTGGVAIGRYGPLYYGGHSRGNRMVHNHIAWNGGNGVTIWEYIPMVVFYDNADGNGITGNSIHDNLLLGIDLQDNGVTLNDPLDPDPLANQELNFPVMVQAAYCAGHTLVTGSIDIDTNPTLATVEVFRAQLDPLNFGEGEIFLGAAVPDALGNWSMVVAFMLTPVDLVTATTTDLNGNTSEFCRSLQVALSAGCGDLNGDGATDGADLLLLAAYLAGSTPGPPPGADFNYDSVVDGYDLVLLQQVVVGNL